MSSRNARTAFGVDLLHEQMIVHLGRVCSDRHGEGVRQRVGGVRGEHERPVPGARSQDGRASSRRGLADTALAGEEDGPQGQPSDSTRLLSPRSAVSMMTFSAFRFSIPIIGMATSTARE